MRKLLATCAAIVTLTGAHIAFADPVTITLARFFGACEADYGTSTDVEHAHGECGIITTLVNRFNQQNAGQIVVQPQIIEWVPYYDTITARLVSHDVPTVAVMHMSQLGDFAARKLVMPLDDVFKDAGVDANDFTPAAKRGVTIGGHMYALPWDTHSWLWHVNVGLMKQAGLVDADGHAILPKTAEESDAEATKFKAATGKPLYEFAALPDVAGPARTFYTLVGQQGATVFSDAGKPDFSTPAAHAAVDWMSKLYTAGDMSKQTDYAAATAGFMNGDAGIYISGTWLIDTFMESQAKAGSPLSSGYDVTAFPTLYGKPADWADGHSWVLLRGALTDANKPAVLKFMKYMFDNNIQWARTGHLPIRQSVIDSPAFLDLPHRREIARISQDAVILPHDVRRQFGIQTIISEETENVMSGAKTTDVALQAMQTRTDTLLANTH